MPGEKIYFDKVTSEKIRANKSDFIAISASGETQFQCDKTSLEKWVQFRKAQFPKLDAFDSKYPTLALKCKKEVELAAHQTPRTVASTPNPAVTVPAKTQSTVALKNSQPSAENKNQALPTSDSELCYEESEENQAGLYPLTHDSAPPEFETNTSPARDTASEKKASSEKCR